MWYNGTSEEFSRVILNIHEGTSCKVIVDGSLTDPFVTSVVCLGH